jgi:hypothetical protein
MLVKIINDAVDTFPYSVRKLKEENPNTSFLKEMPPEALAEWGVYRVETATKPTPAPSQTAVPADSPALVDSVWTLGWTVRDWTADELTRLARNARYDRDEKLSESDWTQMPDSPLDSTIKASWATYRTALRDVTEQSGFPTDITWPTAP